MADVLLEQLAFVTTLPCLAEPGKVVIVGRPSASLEAVLPYVNAVLPNVLAYQPAAATMTLRRQPGLISLYADKVYITQVKDAEEGLLLLDALCDLINKVWALRTTVTPSARPRRRAGARRLRARPRCCSARGGARRPPRRLPRGPRPTSR